MVPVVPIVPVVPAVQSLRSQLLRPVPNVQVVQPLRFIQNVTDLTAVQKFKLILRLVRHETRFDGWKRVISTMEVEHHTASKRYRQRTSPS
jgi:hypothetical protein